IGINSLLENKNIADDSILNDNLSNNVVSDYPATTGYVSLANQFRHSVKTNQGWIGLSSDSKTLLYTTFDGVRRWTKEMPSTIYDAKFNHYDNTLTVLTHSPDATGNHFFTITLLDIEGNTLSVFRDSLPVSNSPLDPNAPSPYSLKIVKNNNELWTMVSVNPLAYLAPLAHFSGTTNPTKLRLFVSTKDGLGSWTTSNSSEMATLANETANNWISKTIPDTIIGVAGHVNNLKIISDFQFFIRDGKVSISTVTRHHFNNIGSGIAVFHVLRDITVPSSKGSSFVQDVNLRPLAETPIFGITENENFRKGIAGIGYSRFFPENNNELLIPIRTTYANYRAPVAVVALESNGTIRLPVNYSDANLERIFWTSQSLYSPFNLVRNLGDTTTYRIFSELALAYQQKISIA
ncbi:MAG: hypothetical protein KFW07_00790, partial [Mycoplasmataceae bacterium]|nr:hypothetical protein [Mycoplasmataceae bacterium]